MAAVDTGSAYARFSLDYSGLESGAVAAGKILENLRKQAQDPIVAQILSSGGRVSRSLATGLNSLQGPPQMAAALPNATSVNTRAQAQQNAGLLQVATAAALTSTAVDNLIKKQYAAAVSARDWKSAEAELLKLLGQSGGDLEAQVVISGKLAAVRRNMVKDDNAAAKETASLAAEEGHFGQAIQILTDRMNALGKAGAGYLQLLQQLKGYQADVVSEMTKGENAAIAEAKANGNLAEQIRLVEQAKSRATARGDVGREQELAPQLAGLQQKQLGIKSTDNDALSRAAQSAKDYGEALNRVDLELAKTSNSTARIAELEGRRATLSRQLQDSLNDVAIAQSKLYVSQGELGNALVVLEAREHLLIQSGQEYLAIEREIQSVLNDSISKQAALGDAEVKRLVIQKQLSQALAKVRELSADAPKGPAGDNRRADLSVQEAQIIAQIAAAEAKQAKSETDLARQSKQYKEAIDNLVTSQKNYIKNSTEWNILEKERIAITQQMTSETNKDTDAQIRAAIAAKQYSYAIAVLEKEQQKVLADGNLRRFDTLAAQISKVQRAAQQGSVWGQFLSGIKNIVAPLGAGYLALEGFRKGVDLIKDSLNNFSEIDLARRNLDAFFDNVARGDRVFQAGQNFATQYRLSYKEVASAAQDAGLILRTSNVEAERAFSVLARLQQRAPNKNFQDAVRSIVELQSGQLQSIERVFNVPQRFAKELERAIKAGADPIEALDALLNRLGNTAETLNPRIQGLAGSQNRVSNAVEGISVTIGKLLEGPATAFLEWLGKGLEATNELIGGLENFGKIKNFDTFFKVFTDLEKQDAKAGKLTGAQGLFNAIVNAYIATGAAGQDAANKEKAANDQVIRSIDDVRKAAISAQPDLRQYLPHSSPERQKFDDEVKKSGIAQTVSIDNIIDRMNTLNSSYDEGSIDAVKLSDKVKELTKDFNVPSDSLEFIKQLKADYPDTVSQLDQLQILREKLQKRQGDPSLSTQEKVTFIAESRDVDAEIAKLEGHGPITIDVQFQVDNANEVQRIGQEILDATGKLKDDRSKLQKSYYDDVAKLEDESLKESVNYLKERGVAERNYNDQRLRAERDFGQQQSQQAADFARQQKEQDDDFAAQRQRTLRDYAIQRGRALRDYQLQDSRTNEDNARADARKERDRRQEDLKSEKDHLKDMQRARREFDISNTRDTEDFTKERRRLLAEGRVKEAQLLGEQFKTTQGRKAEDFVRNRSDQVDAFGQTKADRDAQRKQQDADASQDRKIAQARRAADFAQQRADQAADFQRQLDDADAQREIQKKRAEANFKEQQDRARAAFKQQQDDAATAYAQQRKDAEDAHNEKIKDLGDQIVELGKKYKQQQTDLETEYKAHLARLTQQYKDFQDDAAAIQSLVDAGMDKALATSIVKMQRTVTALKNLGLDQLTDIEKNGYKVGFAWVKGIADALKDFAESGVDPALDPKLDRIREKIDGNSPPRYGPLRNIDRGGYNVGKAWSDAFARGINLDDNPLQKIDAQLHLAPTGGATVLRTTPRNINPWNTPPAQPNAARQLHISVPLTMTVDGRSMGKVVAPHVADVFMDDLQVSVDIVDASQTIAYSQTGFRGNPSSTRS